MQARPPFPAKPLSAPPLCATNGHAGWLIPNRRRTYYPGLRLWRAELKAGVAGQDPGDPSTWQRDALFLAVQHEIDACTLDEIGLKAEARDQAHNARSVFLAIRIVGRPPKDSHYRRALYARACQTLGVQTAATLALKLRPRIHSRA